MKSLVVFKIYNNPVYFRFWLFTVIYQSTENVSCSYQSDNKHHDRTTERQKYHSNDSVGYLHTVHMTYISCLTPQNAKEPEVYVPLLSCILEMLAANMYIFFFIYENFISVEEYLEHILFMQGL